MFMWSLIIVLVNSGRRSSEGVLLLDPMFENKCLEKVQLCLESAVFIWLEDFSFDDPTDLANLYNRSQYI